MSKARPLVFLALMLGLGAGALRAEYLGDVYINPLGLAFPLDGASVGFEWSIPRDQSVRLQGRFNSRHDYPAAADSRYIVGLEAGWRFFLGSGHDLQGFFLGPQIGVGVQNDTYTDSNGRTGATASGTFYRVGLEFGHQWILGPGFVITPAVTADFIPSYAVGDGRPAADGRIFGGLELNLGWAIPR